ncbi:glycosyl hydrolase [Paenibacillus sp. CF384]|uniref:glycosyl hydrolase n=1 Tax=Paenibacillus sp. CF384 TaxID=1884382 RepID=UPI00089B676E|nr:glycosyl hydrolase [Paenibacillus sp. CF384]SDX46322.1 Fibronectin type III domain-containing protein [Paenibacillus sp. CF384]
MIPSVSRWLKKTLLVVMITAIALPIMYAASTDKAAAAVSPINANASQEARDLLAYLYSLEGTNILSGQHNFLESPDYWTNQVYAITGKYPAVHGYEMGAISGQTEAQLDDQRQAVVDSAIDWYENGGIVTMMYHANKPGTGYCWSECVQAGTSETEFNQIVTPGTTQYDQLIANIDLVAGYLEQLRDAGVPVLWRPFHEMNGGWFWWGQQPNYYKLWDIMYDRFTNYHGLNNLIWVWNANTPNTPWGAPYSTYFPGIDKVDVLAVDVYNNDYQQSYHDDLQTLSQGKIISIGECGEHPNPSTLASSQTKYRWFMTWGEFLTNGNTTAQTQALYSDSRVLTLDEVNIVPGSGGIGGGGPGTVDDSVTGTGLNQFEYVGTWTATSGSSVKYNGGDHYSLTTNSYYQVDFNGTGIKLYGTKDAHHGIAAVSIDGGTEIDVDFYAGTRADNILIWTSPALAAGSHTVKVRVKGTKNASSTGYVVTADRVVIDSDTQAPTAPASLTSPSQTQTSINLSWSASTDNVGVTGYDVYRGSTLAGSTTSTSFSVTGLTAGTAYSFTVKAKDGAGNVSAASNTLNASTASVSNETIVNDATTGTGLNQFEYVGTWNTSTGAGTYNGDDHYSLTTNSYYQVDFNGKQIKLYGSKDAHHGIAAVSIDGGTEVDVDFYSATRTDNTLLWTSPVVTSGAHTLKVRVKGTKNAGSSGYVVTADRVTVISETVVTTDDRDSAITYSGSWTLDNWTGDYADTEKYSKTTNDYAQFTFTGNKIQVIGYKQHNLGKVGVYIDGVLDSTVDLYTSGTGPQQAVLYEKSGLSSGSHTIKLVVTGTKNSSSSDYFVVLDAFKVFN